MDVNKIVYCYHNCDNHNVTDFYVDVIKSALKGKGYDIIHVDFCDSTNMDKKQYLIVIDPLILLRWYLKGFRKFIYWSQGVFPEESSMRHNNSIARYFVAGVVEKFALKHADIVFVVSSSMVWYFEKKYRIKLQQKTFVMPCYNCELEKECFFEPDKYINNIFCYVGSLTIWQCFEETVNIYLDIAKHYGNTELLVCTGEQEKAEEILRAKGVNSFKVMYVDKEKLPKVLAKCKFGFIIRENNIVNKVATPTKLSTYLSCGVIPIVSDCIEQYNDYFEEKKYLLTTNGNDVIDKIKPYVENKIDAEDVYHVYKSFYNDNYNTAEYVKRIGEFLTNQISIS